MMGAGGGGGKGGGGGGGLDLGSMFGDAANFGMGGMLGAGGGSPLDMFGGAFDSSFDPTGSFGASQALNPPVDNAGATGDQGGQPQQPQQPPPQQQQQQTTLPTNALQMQEELQPANFSMDNTGNVQGPTGFTRQQQQQDPSVDAVMNKLGWKPGMGAPPSQDKSVGNIFDRLGWSSGMAQGTGILPGQSAPSEFAPQFDPSARTGTGTVEQPQTVGGPQVAPPGQYGPTDPSTLTPQGLPTAPTGDPSTFPAGDPNAPPASQPTSGTGAPAAAPSGGGGAPAQTPAQTPDTTQPDQTPQRGGGQQGGQQISPQRLIGDLIGALQGRPGSLQRLVQDFLQAQGMGGMQGGQGGQYPDTPWLQTGGRAPPGTNPNDYPMMPGYRPGERRRPGETVPPSASPARTNAPGPGGGTTAAPGASPQATPPTNAPGTISMPASAVPNEPGSIVKTPSHIDASRPIDPRTGLPRPVDPRTVMGYASPDRPTGGQAAISGALQPGQRNPVFTAANISIPRGSNASANTPRGVPAQPTVDRRSFQREIAGDRPSLPEAHSLHEQGAWMVAGEVGLNAPVDVQRTQLETAFNRAQYRGQSLAHALLPSRRRGDPGYYDGLRGPGTGTYATSKRPTPQQLMRFKTQVWDPVVAGSNTSDIGWGPMTGNASAGVAANQFRRGTLGYKMRGGDTYFRELVRPGQLLPTMQNTMTAGP